MTRRVIVGIGNKQDAVKLKGTHVHMITQARLGL
jgi:hypothetical protein